MDLRSALRLYLIADAGLVQADRLPDVVERALAGGVTIVQLRAKGLTTRAYVDAARALLERCAAHGVPFIVNDRADVAAVVGADGVHVGHVGEEDLTPEEVRGVIRRDAIVGVSVGGAPEAARVRGASYLSAGPMYATATKSDAGPAAGPDLARRVRAVTSLPLVAIGGITVDRCAELMATGIDGVCVGAAILLADDPRRAAQEFARALATKEVA